MEKNPASGILIKLLLLNQPPAYQFQAGFHIIKTNKSS